MNIILGKYQIYSNGWAGFGIYHFTNGLKYVLDWQLHLGIICINKYKEINF